MANSGFSDAKTPTPWRFSNLFNWGRPKPEDTGVSTIVSELKGHYPENALEIVLTINNVLRHRQKVVDYLRDYPELNDHGFFMVMCLMYLETHEGHGYAPTQITRVIELFSPGEISHGTATRRLQSAVAAKVFISDKDSKDSRRQRYYLHENVIKLISEMFGGLIDDIVDMRNPPTMEEGGGMKTTARAAKAAKV